MGEEKDLLSTLLLELRRGTLTISVPTILVAY